MSPFRKIVFASIPLVALWLAIEAGLRLAGVGSTLESDDPFVGFESTLPLFVPDEDAQGRPIYRTASNKLRFFNSQHFLREKPAAAKRIFCLGGSTTYGRPYGDTTSFCGWLRGALSVLAPETDWEIVNAGGISYASYRVAALMAEIVEYQPDLVVVYTGHNEFLEERSYGSVRDTPAWWRAIDRRLRSLRTYAVVARLLQPREVLSGEVDAWLDLSAGLDAYTRDDALASAVAVHFRTNLERIVDRAALAGVELVLVTPAANLAASAPFKSEASAGLSLDAAGAFEAHLEKGKATLAAGDAEAAVPDLAGAVRIDPRHARARFELGRALLASGDLEAATREFEAARDQDVCPLRANSQLVRIAREVAAARDVLSIDYPQLLQAASNDERRPPGAEWFLDHVHPTIEAHQLLARALLDRFYEIGWLGVDPRTVRPRLDQIEARAMADLDPRQHGVALRNLAKVLSWSGKTEEAARAAASALELIPDDAESLFVLALEASEWGEHAQAVALLREVLWYDPDWVKARLNLGVELSRMGRPEEAREEYLRVLELAPDHPSARFNLANVLSQLGRREEAIAAYRESLAMNPRDRDAQRLLGELTAEAVRR